ncbi:PREDICTED: translation initiation factor IF-2-like [Rhinopithecus bieti]|uniref:translation initiation factor IF-2-like n=1 Tax=Rhinopithecus bieti TaxID=61621 RepID=UPI00083C6A84|nr:PREDICTED: translation initiation factor IF-2-like [Rhinopithecus bieti]
MPEKFVNGKVVGQSSAGLLPDLSLGGFPETEPTPAKTWADRRGQGIRGPGPSLESEKCSQEDARLLRPVADTRGQGGAAGTAAGGGSRPDPARGRTKGGRGGRLLAPACGVAPLRHRSGRGEPRARPPRAVAGKGDTAHACGARRRLPARPIPRAGGGPAPFQAQQRPRRGPALTHFPSRLLGPRPRIQRPPPSRCEPSGGARGRRRGWAPEPPRAPHHSFPGRASPTDLWLGSSC